MKLVTMIANLALVCIWFFFLVIKGLPSSNPQLLLALMMLVAPVTALVALWQSPKRHGEDSVASLAADAVRAKLRRIIRENTQ